MGQEAEGALDPQLQARLLNRIELSASALALTFLDGVGGTEKVLSKVSLADRYSAALALHPVATLVTTLALGGLPGPDQLPRISAGPCWLLAPAKIPCRNNKIGLLPPEMGRALFNDVDTIAVRPFVRKKGSTFRVGAFAPLYLPIIECKAVRCRPRRITINRPWACQGANRRDTVASDTNSLCPISRVRVPEARFITHGF